MTEVILGVIEWIGRVIAKGIKDHAYRKEFLLLLVAIAALMLFAFDVSVAISKLS